MCSYFKVPARKLQRHYKHKLSGYSNWDQRKHADAYLLFPQNIGPYLSIDEVALSRGELYTIVSNKDGKGGKGTLVAVIRGTLSSDIIAVLDKIPLIARNRVKEVTMDMANNMESAARTSFPLAKFVTDRFHVAKLAIAALQHIRVKYRWDELEKENNAIAEARKNGEKYKHDILLNGDTPKQLLARSMYILAKKPNDWTDSQALRAKLLFERYPIIHTAYRHVLYFRNIYEEENLNIAKSKFTRWIQKTYELKIKEFNTVANTVGNHLEYILNFFINRNTNANAESFNSKIKLFRANQRGVVDQKFFLFRLTMLFS